MNQQPIVVIWGGNWGVRKATHIDVLGLVFVRTAVPISVVIVAVSRGVRALAGLGGC
jgi:hypothetical protein